MNNGEGFFTLLYSGLLLLARKVSFYKKLDSFRTMWIVVCYRDHFRISNWGQWSRGFNFVTKYLAVVKNGKLLNYSISFYCKNSNRIYLELDACMSYLSGGLVLICLISSWSSLSVLWRFVSSFDMFWPLSAKAGWLTCSILICFWINT